MDGRFMGPGWHDGLGFFGGLFGIVLFAAFIGLLVWALMRLMSHDHRVPHLPAGPWQPRDAALDAARIRYASGELDRDQYFRVVEDLTGVPHPAAPPAASPPAAAPPAAAEPSTPPEA